MWASFDALTTRLGAPPWRRVDGRPMFAPNFALLRQLIAAPLAHGVKPQSGMHAKAIDVWIASELRRAGFGMDEVWPRASKPRVMPREVALVLDSLPNDLRSQVLQHLRRSPAGAVSADAVVLGRAYHKQVDVVVSQWARGPELLVSTKRMDSSLSNNALNRIEESYGDAHNLRGRYPMAAIGYVLVIRHKAVLDAQSSATRLMDLVGKLGRDPAGYDATAVVVADWEDVIDGQTGRPVAIVDDAVPSDLNIGRFFEVMIQMVVDRTPIDAHVAVRALRDGIRPID